MTPSLLLGIALVVAAPGLKETPKQPAKIEGEWLVESMEGPKGTPLGPVTFRFTENKISVLEGKRDRAEDVGYTVDLTKKPATIDMRPEKGQQDLIILGIIEVNGDTMKLCFGRDGIGRPTEFKGDAEKGVMMITLKRIKTEK